MTSEFLSQEDKSVLELEVRRKIYGVVKKYAGAHFREIQRKVNLSTGTVQYHLDYLARQGLLKTEKSAKNVRFFPRHFSTENKKLMTILRQNSMRTILLSIVQNPRCIQEDIIQFVKLSPSTVSWHLKKLQQENIITSTKKGRKTHYDLAIDKKEIVALLITYQETFLDTAVDNIVKMWDL